MFWRYSERSAPRFIVKDRLVESIEEKLLGQLTSKFGGNPRLSDSLVMIGVDSVGMAELTVEIERDFAIAVDDQILGVETVQELADYVRTKQTDKRK